MKEIIVTRMEEIPEYHRNEHSKYEFFRRSVTGNAAQGYRAEENNKTIVAFYTIPPGKSNFPYHYHTANEEVFYIISGKGILETEHGKREIKTGDVVVCPTGKNGAHRITNLSEAEDLIYIDIDTNNSPEVAFYPHVNKVGFRADGGIWEVLDSDAKRGYYEGE